jgi:predicted alpha/beta hydrolase family esterase
MAFWRFATTLLVVATPGLASCGGDEPNTTRSADQTATATATATSEETELDPVIDGKFRVGSPEQELAIRCWGSGEPAVVLDSGSASSGIETFGALSEEIITPLARRSTVCTYDRAGTGATAELPMKRRTIDDQAEELNALLAAADVPTPRVLVGASWGGFVVVHTARNYPDGVGGIVLLDVPAGNAHLTADEAPEAAWDHPTNVERVDSFHAERTMARDKRSLDDLPVTVVTADAGQSDENDQRFWKRLSSNFSQVVLRGGHDIYNYDPEGVVEQILKAVDAAD